MKRKIWSALGVLAGLIGVVAIVRSTSVIMGPIATETSLSYSKNYTIDLASRGVFAVSAQVTMSTQNTVAASFTDGSQSNFSITVTSYPNLVESRSSATITVSSNTAMNGSVARNVVGVSSNSALLGTIAVDYIFVSSKVNETFSSITLNSLTFNSSAQYLLGASSAATAINIANAINNSAAYYDILAATISVAGDSTQTIKVYSMYPGSRYDRYTLRSSTGSMQVVTSSFTGGSDPVVLTLTNLNDVFELTAGIQFDVKSTSYATAIALSSALNNRAEYMIGASTAGLNGSSVTVYSDLVGTQFNNYVLTSSSNTALQILVSTFSGGADPVRFSINGVVFISSSNFFTDITASGTAANIRQLIATTTVLSGLFSGTNTVFPGIIITSNPNNSNTINITAVSTGSAYVYPLFTSSQSALSLSYVQFSWSGSTFSSVRGGRDVAYIKAGPAVIRQGVDWFAAISNTNTAQSISDALSSRTALGGIFITTWTVQGSTGIVFSTSVANGTYWNFSLFSSSQSLMTLSGNVATTAPGVGISTATGGTDVNYSTTTDIISLPNNTLGTANPVLFTTGTGVSFSPLVLNTTYFVIKTDTTSIKLARTSTDAVNGNAIDLLTISTQATTHSFTLTPIPPLGNTVGFWQVSNDSISWFGMTTATMTLASPYVSTTTYNDFGTINARYLRYVVNTSTSGGGYQVTITVHGRN